MINPKDDFMTARFTPRVLEGGLSLDIERLSRTMAVLEDYLESMMAMDDPLPGSPRIEEDELQLRMASL